jgi:hypothetical protein
MIAKSLLSMFVRSTLSELIESDDLFDKKGLRRVLFVGGVILIDIFWFLIIPPEGYNYLWISDLLLSKYNAQFRRRYLKYPTYYPPLYF